MRIIVALAICMLGFTLHAQRKEILYVGTFSVRESEGIYVYEFDRKQATFNRIQTVRTPESPTFLAVHPSGKYLYAVSRGTPDGQANSGSVQSFSIDRENGTLTLINQKISHGNSPCHISTDHTGKLAFVSHYAGGTLSVFMLNNDGSIGELTDSIVYTGNSVNKERQDKPHTHAAIPSPDNRFLMVTDLGTDRVYSYKIDLRKGKLLPAAKAFTTVRPGSGPRHFTFRPNGKHAYLAEELTSSVCVFRYNRKSGMLKMMHDSIPSLPPNFSGTNTSADIHTDVSGRFLFLSNRGHQSLTVYEIRTDGSLKFLFNQKMPGEKPRNFLVDHQNEFLLVAHQDTDNIVMLRWNDKQPALTPLEKQIAVPSPVCLKLHVLR